MTNTNKRANEIQTRAAAAQLAYDTAIAAWHDACPAEPEEMTEEDENEHEDECDRLYREHGIMRLSNARHAAEVALLAWFAESFHEHAETIGAGSRSLPLRRKLIEMALRWDRK